MSFWLERLVDKSSQAYTKVCKVWNLSKAFKQRRSLREDSLNPWSTVFTPIIYSYSEPRPLNLTDWTGENCRLVWSPGSALACWWQGQILARTGQVHGVIFYAFNSTDGGDVMMWRTFNEPFCTNYPLNVPVSLIIVSDQVHPFTAIHFQMGSL